MPITPRHREKVFGPGWAVPLDRNTKARIAAYARAWSAHNRQAGQHHGPITRTFLDVLEALLWGFHNSRSGACFPSYARIAAKAECARSTVAEALKVLEWAGILTWQHRIARVRERCRDLWGRSGWTWRVVRLTNAYVFKDPATKSENRPRTPIQDNLSLSLPAVACGKLSRGGLQEALDRLGATLAASGGSATK